MVESKKHAADMALELAALRERENSRSAIVPSESLELIRAQGALDAASAAQRVREEAIVSHDAIVQKIGDEHDAKIQELVARAALAETQARVTSDELASHQRQLDLKLREARSEDAAALAKRRSDDAAALAKRQADVEAKAF